MPSTNLPAPIDFQHAQHSFTKYLERRILGQLINGKLIAKTQRLADEWFEGKTVLLGSCGLQITGCKLSFGLGKVNVERWLTRFIVDRNRVHDLVPNAIALGYLGEYQLYLADYENVPHLIARTSGGRAERWSARRSYIPSKGTALFSALERAKALGYLSTLQGFK